MQLAKHTRQFRRRHMEQRGIGEYAVEQGRGQVQFKEVLMPDFAAGVGARHLYKTRRAVEADGAMAELAEGLQVAARTAAEV